MQAVDDLERLKREDAEESSHQTALLDITSSQPEEDEDEDAAENDAEEHAENARQAASVAKQAAHVANKVAAHSVKVTGHAKKALKHALGALHDARVGSAGLDKHQKHTLKKAEAKLREATEDAEYGRLKETKDGSDVRRDRMRAKLDKGSSGKSEKEELLQEIAELRKKLKEKDLDDKDNSEALDELESSVKNGDGKKNDEIKVEIERLREQVGKYEALDKEDEKEAVAKRNEAVQDGGDAAVGQESVTPVEEKGIDIDTQLPYGDLEPFGREDTAQELTEGSIRESDGMVDQLERAEVSEEKRAVYRALTRLRGAAITSFDGIARSQTGNIDEYNKIHKWRRTHPLHHLADEESDISKWAFPDNADF